MKEETHAQRPRNGANAHVCGVRVRVKDELDESENEKSHADVEIGL